MSLSDTMRGRARAAAPSCGPRVCEHEVKEWAKRAEKMEKALAKIGDLEEGIPCHTSWAVTQDKLYEAVKLAREVLSEERAGAGR